MDRRDRWNSAAAGGVDMKLLHGLALIVGVVFGGAFSQAPEFAQQYRQRLGGALDELTAIVQRFDQDAARAGLDRRRAARTSRPK